ncbi:DMT family transporter [Amphritea sp. HPY]|uniref:DMT family transporter n=1 Tax=Amphritea sp. HPY TaxID=3421652 RepID=UPI003D7DA2C7
MVKNELDRFAIILLVILCAIWGCQQVAIKWALVAVPPLLQAGLRSLIAVVLLMLWMLWKGEKPWSKDGGGWWGVLAGVLFAGEFQMLYWGLEYTSASRAAVFLYTSPFVVALGAHFLLPGEALTKLRILGLVIAFSGIVLAFYNGSSTGGKQLYGDLMVLLGAVFWGCTTLVIKASPQRHLSAEKVLFYQLAVSALLLPLGSWLLAEPAIGDISATVVGSVLYQSVVVAFISYTAWFWLVREYPASKVAAFGFLSPMFGVLAGYFLLQEQINQSFMIALLLVLGGIWLVNRPRPALADN